jgi:hypothetical protein
LYLTSWWSCWIQVWSLGSHKEEKATLLCLLDCKEVARLPPSQRWPLGTSKFH